MAELQVTVKELCAFIEILQANRHLNVGVCCIDREFQETVFEVCKSTAV
jgi:hypothetical protein